MQLSVLVPGIRTEKWLDLYKSIEQSFHGSFEIVFVGPYYPPESVASLPNVKFIMDRGCPSRCRQIALLNCSGDWAFFGADDLEFFPNSLDKAFAQVDETDYKKVVLCKYREGAENPDHLTDQYYKLNHHDSLRFVGSMFPDYWILMCGIISTKLLKEIGGWDAQFEVCAMACIDLSIRLQNYGAEFVVHSDPIFQGFHIPGTEGDHAPIHYAQTQHDGPLFNFIYSTAGINRTTIPLNNWEMQPVIWERRFK